MSTITLTVAQCKALLLHIPKSDVRYYMVGLHVVPERTDGVLCDDAKRAKLSQVRETLDNVRGDINPERGYADELEADVVAAIAILDELLGGRT